MKQAHLYVCFCFLFSDLTTFRESRCWERTSMRFPNWNEMVSRHEKCTIISILTTRAIAMIDPTTVNILYTLPPINKSVFLCYCCCPVSLPALNVLLLL